MINFAQGRGVTQVSRIMSVLFDDYAGRDSLTSFLCGVPFHTEIREPT